MSILDVEPDSDTPPETQSETLEEPLNHVALNVHVPDMTGITNAELQAIRSHIQSVNRETRKKSNVLMGKEEGLRPFWLKTLGMGTRSSPEEKKAAHEAFERELLRHPAAFLSYAMANSLVSIDSIIRDEIMRRTKIDPIGKKKP